MARCSRSARTRPPTFDASIEAAGARGLYLPRRTLPFDSSQPGLRRACAHSRGRSGPDLRAPMAAQVSRQGVGSSHACFGRHHGRSLGARSSATAAPRPTRAGAGRPDHLRRPRRLLGTVRPVPRRAVLPGLRTATLNRLRRSATGHRVGCPARLLSVRNLGARPARFLLDRRRRHRLSDREAGGAHLG